MIRRIFSLVVFVNVVLLLVVLVCSRRSTESTDAVMIPLQFTYLRADGCLTYGYDLRASTERCSECGSAISSTTAPAASHA